MSVVFIGGSRRIKALDKLVCGRLDNIIAQSLHVIIGDADGADTMAQKYLSERGYKPVTVYCTEGICRNNVGSWPVQSVDPAGQRGFAYYAMKDAEMVRRADCGFMIWDGSSKGTLLNVLRLVGSRKALVLYVAPDRQFLTLRSSDDVNTLTSRYPEVFRKKLLRTLGKEREKEPLFSQERSAPNVSSQNVEILQKLIHEKSDEIRRIAARHGAFNVRVFGSVARGEEGPDSDVDVLVDVGRQTSAWFPAGLIVDLEDLLGRRVEVITERALNPDLQASVLREAMPV